MNELQITRTPEIIGAEIRHITYQVKCTTLYGGIEIGRRLKEAKAAVPYGRFGEFLKNETEFSSSAAGRFMQLFDEYGPMLEGGGELFPTLGKVSVSNALRLLALPENEREEFVVEHNVENISTRELDKLIAERDEALKRAEEAETLRKMAENDLESAEEQKNDLEEKLKGLTVEYEAVNSGYDDLEKERDNLEKELEELRSRPVDVAVEVDEEAVKKAAEKATAAADEKWRKELDAAKQAGEQAKGEAEKLRTALDEAKQAAEAAEKKAAGGNADYEAKINSLQKQLAMSGAEITTFKLLFDSWQQAFNRMVEALQAVPEENREKMTAAVKMVLEGQVSRV